MRRRTEHSGLRRRITALLSLPILLLALTGCFEGEMNIAIGTDGNTTVHAQGVALMPGLTRDQINCDELVAEEDVLPGRTATAENYEENGRLGCTMEASGPTAEMVNEDGSYMVTQDGDVLTFNMQGDPTIETESEEMAMFGEPQMSITVEFPGDVIDGGGGEVSGNTVTYTGLQWLQSGFTATGSASPGFFGSIPAWALWGGIALIVVIVVVIIAVVVSKKSKKKKAAAGAGAGGYGAGQQQWGQPGSQQQWGQPGGQQQWGQPGGAYGAQQGWNPGQQQYGAGSPAQSGWDQGQGQQFGAGSPAQAGWDQQQNPQGGWDQPQDWNPGNQGNPNQQGNQGWS